MVRGAVLTSASMARDHAITTARLPAAARLLLAARFTRSVWQGSLVAAFALYLERLHWRGEQIGTLFAVSFLVGAMLSLLVGPLSDRYGYRRLLIGYEAVTGALFVLATCSANPLMIATAAVFGGFGRGANGAPGCFVPAELAWLAAVLSEQQRVTTFSVNTAIGFAGMALGALIGASPDVWGGWLSGAAAFRPLFAMGAVLALVNVWLLCLAPSVAGGQPSAAPDDARPPITGARRNLLVKVSAINACNGIAVGLSGPLIAYWFAARFGVGLLQIGPMMLVCFASAALCALAVRGTAARVAGAAVYIRLQWISLLLMLLMPFAPNFAVAATIWIVKFGLERGSSGAMEAVNVGLAGKGRWGLASGLSVASLAMPRSIGPIMAGHWIAAGEFAVPFLAAGGLQAGYLLLYRRAVLPMPRMATGRA